MTGRYATEDQALKRVEVLKRSGIWPGARRHADGSASLLFDLQLAAPAREDS